MNHNDWTQAACMFALWGLLIGFAWSVWTRSPWPALLFCVPAGLALLAELFANGVKE